MTLDQEALPPVMAAGIFGQQPLSQATSMAWRMALPTLLGVVWNVLATCGYNTFVMALACLTARLGSILDALIKPTK